MGLGGARAPSCPSPTVPPREGALTAQRGSVCRALTCRQVEAGAGRRAGGRRAWMLRRGPGRDGAGPARQASAPTAELSFTRRCRLGSRGAVAGWLAGWDAERCLLPATDVEAGGRTDGRGPRAPGCNSPVRRPLWVVPGALQARLSPLSPSRSLGYGRPRGRARSLRRSPPLGRGKTPGGKEAGRLSAGEPSRRVVWQRSGGAGSAGVGALRSLFPPRGCRGGGC